jgi:hypothetical protein
MTQQKKATPADELVALVNKAKDSLTAAEKLARTIPEASSVRPPISQAKDALSSVGFSAEVGKL